MKPHDNEKPAAARKPYARPVVQSYGSVRAMTRTGGTMSANMDGANSKSKTL
jgi:hypothetical protein